MHYLLVRGAMRRDRFEIIFSYLHVSYNTILDSMNRFVKLRTLINKLSENCMQLLLKETSFNIGESKVPYLGNEYIRGTPMWHGATRLCYACLFPPPHQGKTLNMKYEEYDLCAFVVFQFTEVLTEAHSK
ncbi:chimeric ERCC6-PGBD3 protein [Nephila pilipes]|uniref:Chimeric ERCC6-PGBD3 protein n=1 Tax=Nephila pilipes TaxID=299642 RepID=A0A8X6P0C9_NEPPI|nr:chimeric ERCC6-PGBD3 protein [Nephila pilipes]